MTIRNLAKIFRPREIAVIGGSCRADSIGRIVLENLDAAEFPGDIFPVNPNHQRIGERPCFATVRELPRVPDLAVICTPASTVPQLVRECGEAGIKGLVILSAGFREMGTHGELLEAAVRDAARSFEGMRIIGPNCLGVIAPYAALNASFAAAMPLRGHVAFISQSGALCTSVLDWALQENIGFSYFVSVGNMIDVSIGDLLNYFAMDRYTDAIILYVESITAAREFMSAARAFARKKPIIAYKAGCYDESARAAAFHTGALAGVDSVYEAAFNRAGIVRVYEMADMFDCAELLARQKAPRGPRLAIITNAGGPGVMATDALLARNGVLAELSDATVEKLNDVLPAEWSHHNPIDVLEDATPARLSKALEIVLADPGVDAALVLFAPQAMSKPTQTAEAVIEIAKKSYKPVLTAWMGGVSMREGVTLFRKAGVPSYFSPEPAVRAFMYLVSYARIQEVLYETPREVPVAAGASRDRLKSLFDSVPTAERSVLSEGHSKSILDAYEIPTAKPFVAESADEAAYLAGEIGFPVVMKVLSPQITHKTDVGGVAVSLTSADEVRTAFDTMLAQVRQSRPDAQVQGVTIQKMIASPVGHELIVGAKRDPVFGSVLLVGSGGTTAEVFQDRSLELPPLNERLARRMLESLVAWPLLQGFRGRPAVNLDRLIEVLLRLSYLVADSPEIEELDVNPLLVTPEDVIALDARIMLDLSSILQPPRRYAHLAIRPYPDEYTKSVQLSDGTQVLLRPIKPEDEPSWHQLLASCSPESLLSRFRYLLKHTTHEMATRFCYLDYDRELAIVAEVEHEGQRRLVGVGSLSADADRTDAEFSILLADDFQGKGLGSILTTYCLEICRKWGVDTVVAETEPGNRRMLTIFERHGFELDRTVAHDVVIGKKVFT